jgi:hypothetical protein
MEGGYVSLPLGRGTGKGTMTKETMNQARAFGRMTQERSLEIERSLKGTGKTADKAVLFTRAKYQNTLKELADK